MPDGGRLAIYPGTFDPITLGHMDILQRALRVFDKVEVAIGVNAAKKALFPVDLRLELVQECTSHLDRVTVASFDGLVVEYAQNRRAVALVRGLRDAADLQYEMRMCFANRRLQPGIETIFFAPSEEHALVSASIVRELHRYGGDVSSFVPPPVLRALEAVRNSR